MSKTINIIENHQLAYQFIEQQKNGLRDLKSYIYVVVSHEWHPVSNSVRTEKRFQTFIRCFTSVIFIHNFLFAEIQVETT